MPDKHTWTVVSRDKEGSWTDESDAYHSVTSATDYARLLASNSATGTFNVVHHEIVSSYQRSIEAIKLS